VSLEEVLKLIPGTRPQDADAAIAVHHTLLMVRAIMKEHLGIDSGVLKSPQQIEFSLRLLAVLREEGQRTKAGAAPSYRDGRQFSLSRDALIPAQARATRDRCHDEGRPFRGIELSFYCHWRSPLEK
jgi:hypothetical protein